MKDVLGVKVSRLILCRSSKPALCPDLLAILEKKEPVATVSYLGNMHKDGRAYGIGKQARARKARREDAHWKPRFSYTSRQVHAGLVKTPSWTDTHRPLVGKR
jgi:hypothetical protein